jgi:hypothetical protein
VVAKPSPEDAVRERVLAQLPSIARTEDPEGGVAVAIAFIEEHPRLFQEGPSELFAYLSLPDCGFCASEQERARRDIAERGLQVGGDMVVDEGDAHFRLGADEFDEHTLVVVLYLTEEPYTFVNAAGEVTQSGDGTPLRATLWLQLRDGIWGVRHFNFERPVPEDVPVLIEEADEAEADA